MTDQKDEGGSGRTGAAAHHGGAADADTPAAGPGQAGAPPFDRRMIEVLVCPVTHGPLELDSERGLLVSRRAGLAYPIRNGIPVMLADEAMPLE